MARKDNKLNFYVIQEDETAYSLYNLNTDKRILRYVEEKELNTFLRMNSPNHPYLENLSQSYTVSIPNGTYDPAENYYIQPTLRECSSLEEYNYFSTASSFGLSDEGYDYSNKNNKKENSPVQLELNLTYNKSKENNKNTVDTSDLPYLGDNEDQKQINP